MGEVFPSTEWHPMLLQKSLYVVKNKNKTTYTQIHIIMTVIYMFKCEPTQVIFISEISALMQIQTAAGKQQYSQAYADFLF